MRFVFSSISLVVIFSLLALNGQAQFKGRITDINDQALPFANVWWLGSQNVVTTDEKGEFTLAFPSDTVHQPFKLVAYYYGLRDSFEFDDLHSYWTFIMDATVTLKEVTVFDEGRGAYISQMLPIKTEVINRAELRKAACCDLAGCFETQSTVQTQTTNILTNAKELRILGLSGVYNQILVDGLPTIQGLSYTYGLSTIPGSMLENIWVVKGANSVLQGYENMVGQITVYPREGGTAEPFTLDLLVNSFGEKHGNAALAIDKNKWTNYLAVHSSQPGNKFDRDDDGFLDLPLITRYSLYNKWRYRKENEKGFSTFLGVRLIDETRTGGQINFDPETDKGSTRSYGQVTRFTQSEFLTKTGYRFDNRRKISLLASSVQHKQQSWFGTVRYQPKQYHHYANLQFEWFYGSRLQHDLKTGISFRNLNVKEQISFTSDTVKRSFQGIYLKNEKIPGAFLENIYTSDQGKWVIITGLRADRHNTIGWMITPRLLVRYQATAQTDLRASIGTGWRTVNLFAENINLLTSNRDLQFEENLKPEKSINMGVNVIHKWNIRNLDFTATADFYHTRFESQFFPDYDRHPDYAIISNFVQPSVSNGFQIELSTGFWNQANLRFAYNYLDVYREVSGTKVSLPFNARHRFLAVASVHSKEPLWQLDFNLHAYGEQRLPDSKLLPLELQQPESSKPFTLVSVQYTHTFKGFEVFTGCENISDFRQHKPIIGYQNPFGKHFDTSFAWGPTRGREFYLGIRFRLEKPEER